MKNPAAIASLANLAKIYLEARESGKNHGTAWQDCAGMPGAKELSNRFAVNMGKGGWGDAGRIATAKRLVNGIDRAPVI